ncbi:hypothetical protein CC78DRAFT_540209 [Lojkania enalia]|uniref:Uncharacterized protein n=1 Tax=Lojkania enalia TaxID=147567 RepID=A0A9P4N9M3_9PLEO|nr:hypothetical protein CC78DRAFT_540209 [Didymosphaeria enalia]
MALLALFLNTLLSGIASAHTLSAPQALITKAPLLPRASTETFGWFSSTEFDETTSYDAWTYDPEDPIISSTLGYWIDWCLTDWCELFTSCGQGAIGGPRTTYLCDYSGGQACYTEVQLQSYGATEPLLKKVLCTDSSWETRTYYRERPLSSYDFPPASAVFTTTAATALDDKPAPTESDPSTGQTVQSDNLSDGAVKGIIAGSTIGGVLLLGLIVLVLYMRRRRNQKSRNQNLNPPSSVQTSQPQPPPLIFNSGKLLAPHQPSFQGRTFEDGPEVRGAQGMQGPKSPKYDDGKEVYRTAAPIAGLPPRGAELPGYGRAQGELHAESRYQAELHSESRFHGELDGQGRARGELSAESKDY